jgi:hypothetical protein
MPNIIIYATRVDAEAIRLWLNDAAEVAWINKIEEKDCLYKWRAVPQIESLQQQEYALWHVESGPLNIPSGVVGLSDNTVADPFLGWAQRLEYAGATRPWFGSNLPGPYNFCFAEDGCEAPGNLARSEFSWLGDRYKSIGKPAHPAANRWWRKLKRFVESSATAVPWVDTLSNRKIIPTVYLFPDAARQVKDGRGRDVNPWSSRRVA